MIKMWRNIPKREIFLFKIMFSGGEGKAEISGIMKKQTKTSLTKIFRTVFFNLKVVN